MRVVLLLLAAVLAASPVAASESSDVVTTVQRFVDGFNKGDTKAILATCASAGSIVDEFSPYQWQGPNACVNWMNSYNEDAKARGITDPVVTLGAPLHEENVGNRAYVVFPAKYTYLEHGSKVVESSAEWTLALTKTGAGWRITGWAWSTGHLGH